MTNVKKAIITDEEAAKTSIEELVKVEEVSIEDEIEKTFNFEPLQVDEVPKQDTTVEVIPLKDDRFYFGGSWYYLTKGRPQKVPLAVRDFLLVNKRNPRIKDIW